MKNAAVAHDHKQCERILFTITLLVSALCSHLRLADLWFEFTNHNHKKCDVRSRGAGDCGAPRFVIIFHIGFYIFGILHKDFSLIFPKIVQNVNWFSQSIGKVYKFSFDFLFKLPIDSKSQLTKCRIVKFCEKNCTCKK